MITNGHVYVKAAKRHKIKSMFGFIAFNVNMHYVKIVKMTELKLIVIRILSYVAHYHIA